jgi:hypothetical protein
MFLPCTGASVTLNEHDDDLTFIPTLQYWGVPENPTRLDLRIWETQELFLRCYARCGRFVRSATAAGITPQCVYKWQNSDKFNFQKRMDIAHQEYVEHLEEQMDEYIRDSKHNTQILQIFRLKAECPEKYREDVKIVGVEPMTQLLEEARKLAARDIERRKQLEEGAAEGEYRDLGEKGQG